MFHRCRLLLAITLVVAAIRVASADDPSDLRLVPFPKEVKLQRGTFPLDAKLVLQVPAEGADLLGRLIGEELKRAGLAVPKVRISNDFENVLRLSAQPEKPPPSAATSGFRFRDNSTPEDYALLIKPGEIVCGAPGGAGLFYGTGTLAQLLRANRTGSALRCMTIRDWPSLRWRCFQDDMTRGPSSKLDTLKLHVDLGASLKMNLFTYYMEYQFAFKKHPIIGPKEGSLTPEDLKALVAYARPRRVDILGNQQSFGHFEDILKHRQYAPLRETSYILCPVKEESYKLLDDLYSEVCPLLRFEMFNVCCDETWGLGKGPSKQLAAKIGVGGVYVRHIRRVHDLLKDKYKKRMMMWGDIILKHPDKLEQIPKDTVMLTWGYSPKDSFEGQIVPFARSGYEFFVCPGISNWSRILPDFGTATINIRNFVRDGARHGAIGMLNTAWEDDGEALQGYKWHGYAWGAECAWNRSETTPEDFNRRVGAVLFGEKSDHFGRAIELLARTHRLPGMRGMANSRFWQDDFPLRPKAPGVRESAEKLLGLVRPAIEQLEACKREATAGFRLLDAFLLGARRMELIGQRMLDGLEIARLYAAARDAKNESTAAEYLATAKKLVQKNRHAHAALGKEFQRLWLAESKPYALDWTLKRYAKHDRQLANLAKRLSKRP